MPASRSSLAKVARRACVLLGTSLLFTGLLVPLPQAAGRDEPSSVQALDDVGYYPRMVRLEHNGLLANSTVVASTVSRGGNGQKVGRIYSSSNGGASFQRIGTIRDPAAAGGKGLCCAALYELPRTVGSLREGTLIWAGTFGGEVAGPKRRMSLRLWTSTDHGRTWRYSSTIAAAPDAKPLWEPAFSVTSDGRLAVFYASEARSPRHSQVLRKVFTRDGTRWSAPQDMVVVRQRPGARAGMPVPLRVPGRGYVMAYEICNLDFAHQCAIYIRSSRDGWNWGNPYSLGAKVRSERGNYPTHTPHIAYSPRPEGTGSIVLTSQTLVRPNGRFAPGNGRTLLVKPYRPKTAWREVPAPVAVPGARNDPCPNFSNVVLPSRSGANVLQLSTDYTRNACRPLYGSGPLR